MSTFGFQPKVKEEATTDEEDMEHQRIPSIKSEIEQQVFGFWIFKIDKFNLNYIFCL